MVFNRILFTLFFSVWFLSGHVSVWAKDQADPRYPERQYRRWVMENGIKVFVISDPSVHHAAAALSVAVGSLSDPKEHQGMAHFLEHMLFLGTEKYPDVGSYQKFIEQNDGDSNAYTAADHTNYHFQIANDRLQEALDRFAQFFIAPLMNPNFVERERHAVSSEHSKNMESDSWRIRQLQKAFFEKTHPENGFATGNLETLSGLGSQEMLTFYHENYSSNLMNLVVLGHEDLDTLQKWINDSFSAVKNQNKPEPHYPENLLSPSNHLRQLSVETVKDTRSLSLFFPLPSNWPYYKSQPLGLMGFLVGHEGEGSLLSFLKKRHWVTGLSAGEGISTNSYASFEVNFELTLEGMNHQSEVIESFFQTIGLLKEKGLPELVFQEEKRMAEINYQFEEKPEGGEYVAGLSALMMSFPLESLERYSLSLTQYDPKVFLKMLDKVVPENMLVVLGSKNEKGDQTDPYYGTHYSYHEEDGALFKKIKMVSANNQLQLPKKNKFIPEKLELLPPITPFQLSVQSMIGLSHEGIESDLFQWFDDHSGQKWNSWEELWDQLQQDKQPAPPQLEALLRKHQLVVPEKLLDTAQSTIWFQQDLRFRSPKAGISLLIYTPNTYQTARQAVLSQLYVEALEESLNEFRYTVTMAGLGFNITPAKEGIHLEVDGYSDHALDLLETLSEKLKVISLDVETFNALKEEQLRSYQNFGFNAPYQQALHFNRLLLEEKKYSLEAYEAEIGSITLKEVQEYAQNLYQKNYVQGVVYGNLKPIDVKKTIQTFLKNIGGSSLPVEKRFQERIVLLKPAASLSYSKGVKIDNSALLWNLQVGPRTPALEGALEIAESYLKSHFYTELRTNQQLGYIVNAWKMRMEDVLSFCFLIQSGDFQATELQKRVMSYLPQFVKAFKSLSSEEFEELRQSVISAKLEKTTSISEETDRLFSIILKRNGDFDYVSADLEALLQLTSTEVFQVVQDKLSPEKQRSIYFLMNAKGVEASPVTGSKIEDINSFKLGFEGIESFVEPY